MYEELLFVDGLGSGNRRHKELIYAACKSHIAKNTHRKRRRARREGRLRTETTFDVRDPGTAPRKHVARDDKDERGGPWSSILETYTRSITEQGIELIPRLYIDPVTLLNGRNNHLGNPAIAISPQMNNAIIFAQLHLNRSQAPKFLLRLLGNKQRALALNQETELRTERWLWGLWTWNAGLFSSVIASVVPLMIRLAPVEEVSQLETMSMDLKSNTFAHLRDLLARSVTRPHADLLTVAYYVKSLFRESCARGDVQAARCHLGMLEQLLTKMIECNIDCNRVALWSDALPALLQMRRPIQDSHTHMTHIIQQVWIEAEAVLPDTDLVNTEVPACVISHTLREAFRHLRKALYVTHVSIVAEDSKQKRRTEKLFQWLTTMAEHHICCLLELFFSLTEPHSVVRDDHVLSRGQRVMELSFALCLLHLYQKCFFEIKKVDGSDIHESAFVIYPLLKSYVRLAETYLTASERAFYKDALFWVVFVGSFAEERLFYQSDRILGDLSQVEAEKSWFDSRVTRESASRRIVRWSEVSRILEQFVWDRSLEPCAKHISGDSDDSRPGLAEMAYHYSWTCLSLTFDIVSFYSDLDWDAGGRAAVQ